MAADLAKCEHCLTGHIHGGTPGGSAEEAVGGVPTYVARPAGGAGPARAAVVILTDVFGWTLPNVRLLADRLSASSGCDVFVPDILAGDALPPAGFDRATFPAWRGRHGDAETMPTVAAVLADVRARGARAVGALGFCFGGRYAALAAAPPPGGGAPAADAYAVAHPSFVTVELFTALTAPGLFLCASTDAQFPPDMADAVEAGLAAGGVAGVEFRRFAGTAHGFAVRGSEDDPVVVAARDEALAAAAAFFSKHLLAKAA
jgi:dienelactone hydrolase